MRALLERDSRLVLIGALGTALLGGLAVALPGLAAGRGPADAGAARHLDRAVRTGSSREFRLARQAALREHHRDLLGRHSPAVLQLIDHVERTTLPCRASSGEAAPVRVACLVRQGRYREARQALASTPGTWGLGAAKLLDRLAALGPFAEGRAHARSGQP